MKIILANPHGFCAGVDRAVEIVNQVLRKHPQSTIYVLHEVVHNKYIINNFKTQGVIFVKEIANVPDNNILIFSAHGVPKYFYTLAQSKNLIIYDATCPLVSKVHQEVIRADRNNVKTILIGHRNHPEVIGTLGQYTKKGSIFLIEKKEDIDFLPIAIDEDLYYVTQTTLSIDDTIDIVNALKRKFINIKGAKKQDICYATTNRQEAVKALSAHSEIILVLGSKNSSNSTRLKETGEKYGVNSYLIDSYKEIDNKWLEGVENIGITAGASAPEILVEEAIEYLQSIGYDELITIETEIEDAIFNLPKELQ
ncbi:MAG: 4-hydroxy-3-methylbut-2-enyl diphosphate reductase [Psittacicella sp.]